MYEIHSIFLNTLMVKQIKNHVIDSCKLLASYIRGSCLGSCIDKCKCKGNLKSLFTFCWIMIVLLMALSLLLMYNSSFEPYHKEMRAPEVYLFLDTYKQDYSNEKIEKELNVNIDSISDSDDVTDPKGESTADNKESSVISEKETGSEIDPEENEIEIIKYKSKPKIITSSNHLLPRIFPVINNKKKIKVCLFNRTPRQRSLFSSNVLSLFGSGKYEYVSMKSTECQHWGTCGNVTAYRKHEECDPNVNPMIILVEWYKKWEHFRFRSVMDNGKQSWDIVIATGDEYCKAFHAYDKAHYRFYFSTNVVANETLITLNDLLNGKKDYKWWKSDRIHKIMNNKRHSLKDAPYYLPLGPREEFQRIKHEEIISSSKRKYLLNFIGSLTSDTRKQLLNETLKLPYGRDRIHIHLAEKWAANLTIENGYMLPSDYRKILLNSTFTLCPQGHNPEAYRIFEACEAGSIPIVVLDASYRNHDCNQAFLPLIESGAPIVFLKSWKGIGRFLQRVVNNKDLLHKMQVNVMEWYSKYMQAIANEFENRLNERFQERLAKEKKKKQL